MKRMIAGLALLCVLVSLTACRARADFSTNPMENYTTPTTTAPAADNDEMGDYAWTLYRDAVASEKALENYDLAYEGSQTLMGKTVKSNARIVRKAEGDHCELLVQTDGMQGYYKDGVAYFNDGVHKTWTLTNEDNFMTEAGFTESPELTEEMFAEAAVFENEDGTRTVSCPLAEAYAAEYLSLTLGISQGALASPTAEICVTVDANGQPVSFQTQLAATVDSYGPLRAESTNRYTETGDTVVLTPPEGLDEYTQDVY